MNTAAIAVAVLAALVGGLALIWDAYLKTIASMLFDIVMQNTLLQAIVIPSVIGTFLYFVQFICYYIYINYVSPYLYSYVTIRSSESEYFEAVLDYVQEQQLLKACHLMACQKKTNRTWKERAQEFLSGEKPVPEISYRPAGTGGVTAMKFQGKCIYVSRSTGETVTVGYDRRALTMETLCLSVFGMDPTILKTFILEALNKINSAKSEDINIYTVSTGWLQGWEKVCFQIH